MPHFRPLVTALALIAFCASAEDKKSEQIEADKKALAPVAAYVGSWKGSGNNRGDGKKDSWGEEAEWAFVFKDGRAALHMTSKDGKFYKEAKLEPGEKAGEFKLSATTLDGKKTDVFSGAIDKEGELVLNNAAPADGRPARISIGLLAKGKRQVITYQKKGAGDRYSPIAEVGLTLQGSGFGKQTDARECIITGGLGTMTVSYKGETYYVCCGGCKQAFEENPEKEIAAYKKRKEEEKKAK
ncbi:MAG TPA: hypothetical protein VEJ63_13195 [Planctomycetota bacterium]|nr:hypothetical protein [Planctomycetota bacterium]